MYRLSDKIQIKTVLSVLRKIRQNCITTLIWGIICVGCCYISWPISDVILAVGLGFVIGISLHTLQQLKKLKKTLTKINSQNQEERD